MPAPSATLELTTTRNAIGSFGRSIYEDHFILTLVLGVILLVALLLAMKLLLGERPHRRSMGAFAQTFARFRPRVNGRFYRVAKNSRSAKKSAPQDSQT